MNHNKKKKKRGNKKEMEWMMLSVPILKMLFTFGGLCSLLVVLLKADNHLTKHTFLIIQFN